MRTLAEGFRPPGSRAPHSRPIWWRISPSMAASSESSAAATGASFWARVSSCYSSSENSCSKKLGPSSMRSRDAGSIGAARLSEKARCTSASISRSRSAGQLHLSGENRDLAFELLG